MKKGLIIASLFCGLMFCSASTDINSSSEAISSEETSENISIVLTEDEEIEQEKETIIQKTQEILSEYLEWDYVSAIVNWLITSGALTTIAILVVKTKRYKGMTIDEIVEEVKSATKEELTFRFEKKAKEESERSLRKIESLEKSLATLTKALVLAQDKTADGKIALLKLIGETTEEEEVKETIEEVKETIIEEKKVQEEIKEKVKGDYTPID